MRHPQSLKNALNSQNQDPNAPEGQGKGKKGKNKKAAPEEYEFDEIYAEGELNVLLDAVEKVGICFNFDARLEQGKVGFQVECAQNQRVP